MTKCAPNCNDKQRPAKRWGVDKSRFAIQSTLQALVGSTSGANSSTLPVELLVT